MTGTTRRLLPLCCLIAVGVVSVGALASRAEPAGKGEPSPGAGTPAPIKPVPAGERVDFTRDIQPILSDRCYFCHGPDAARRKGKLRFDVTEGKDGPFVE